MRGVFHFPQACTCFGLLGALAFGVTLAAFPTAAQAGPPSAVSAPANGVGTPFELTFWESVSESDDPAMFEAYLAQYPGGTFSLLAKAKLAALARRGSSAPPVPQPAPLVSPAMVQVAAVAPVTAPVTAARIAAALPAPALETPPAAPPTAAPPPATPADNASLLGNDELLAMLAQTQSLPSQAPSSQVSTSQAGGAALVPPPPVLETVPDLALPAHFCSAEERNAFHAATYVPALAVASRNSRNAVGYVGRLQQIYDGFRQQKDTISMNVVALAAQAYHPTAEATSAAEAAFASRFGELMAVPVSKCEDHAK